MIQHRPYTQKVDVYSFGVVLWELITGMLPFQNMTAVQAAFAVVNKNIRPIIPNDCLPILGEIMTRCWDANPDVRPPFAEVVKLLECAETEIMSTVRKARFRCCMTQPMTMDWLPSQENSDEAYRVSSAGAGRGSFIDEDNSAEGMQGLSSSHWLPVVLIFSGGRRSNVYTCPFLVHSSIVPKSFKVDWPLCYCFFSSVKCPRDSSFENRSGALTIIITLSFSIQQLGSLLHLQRYWSEVRVKHLANTGSRWDSHQ